ncbi:hypothetical protein GCM10020367_55600 [Streptomyces sannanensis]|uniref:Uncharacterized protein n=1 Tax=Streptomyces sannanensis TaxID=285536 RepID=A0ABP6SJD9_9ACTN
MPFQFAHRARRPGTGLRVARLPVLARAGPPAVHERLRHRLLAELWESGEPEDGSTADVIRTNDTGTHLFEALHAEQPTYVDLREAATRTTEVRFALDRTIDRIFLVCAAAPVEPWAIEAIEGAFDVSVIWWGDGSWQGAEVHTVVPGRG